MKIGAFLASTDQLCKHRRLLPWDFWIDSVRHLIQSYPTWEQGEVVSDHRSCSLTGHSTSVTLSSEAIRWMRLLELWNYFSKFTFIWFPWQFSVEMAIALTHFPNYFHDLYAKNHCSRDAAWRWQESQDAWKCVLQHRQARSNNRLLQAVLNRFRRIISSLSVSDILPQIAQFFPCLHSAVIEKSLS